MRNYVGKIRKAPKQFVLVAIVISLTLVSLFGGLVIAKTGVEYKLPDSEVVAQTSITPDGDVIVDEVPIQRQVEERKKANASSLYYQGLMYGTLLLLIIAFVGTLLLRYKKSRRK